MNAQPRLSEKSQRYWKEYFKKVDACKTNAELEALKDERFYAEEAKLHKIYRHNATEV